MSISRLLSRYADVILACAVVGVVAIIIVPLPPPVLDVLLTFNISLAVLLLLVSVYVTSALQMSAFPSLLLITTLFRLALTISTTRLILLTGDPGKVVLAFGHFVVQGNFVVGFVVFLILTTVNFIVISKGSERVAEVAARFTLDGMPGKQMSIDADLRSGGINLDEARGRRRVLERESQLFGAMDGAMKFVKGDAIASIVIALVNIVGGLTIGVLQRGLPLAEAARRYTLLTVGDGLVAMLPAFLISTCAGIVVTRVAGEEEGANLGREVGRQLTAHPRALAVAGGMLLLLGLVPGLPALPFLLVGTGAAGGAAVLLRRASGGNDRARSRDGEEAAEGETGPQEPLNPETQYLPVVAPIVLEVSQNLVHLVDGKQDGGNFLGRLVPLMRDGLFVDLGVRFPGVRARYNTTFPPNAYQISIHEVPTVVGRVLPGHVLAPESLERLKLLGLTGVEMLHPVTGQPCSWVPEAHRKVLEAAGTTCWDLQSVVLLHLAEVLRRNAREFIGVQETQWMLDQLEKAYPAVVKEVVPKVVSVLKLTEVLRRLVDEEISVRDLRSVLQAIAERGAAETDAIVLTEQVRASLRRYISYKYRKRDTLAVYLLDPQLEDAVRGAIRRGPHGTPQLALEPEIARDIVQAVRTECGRVQPGAQRPVILTSVDIRRYLRRLLEHEMVPAPPVLSFQELAPDLRVQPVAKISA